MGKEGNVCSQSDTDGLASPSNKALPWSLRAEAGPARPKLESLTSKPFALALALLGLGVGLSHFRVTGAIQYPLHRPALDSTCFEGFRA